MNFNALFEKSKSIKFFTLKKIFALLIIGGMFFIYLSIPPTPVVFNFKETNARFLVNLAKRKLPESEANNIARRFPLVVTKAIKIYTKEHHVIILN